MSSTDLPKRSFNIVARSPNESNPFPPSVQVLRKKRKLQSAVEGAREEEELLGGQSSQILPFRTRGLEEVYSVGAELGRGVTGVVRLLKDVDTGSLRAGKTVFKTASSAAILAEIRTMQVVAGHSNVVELCGVFEDEQAVHLAMDLCPGGDLFTYIMQRRALSEREAAYIIGQVASALQHCHRKGILHRDVKPENILISEMMCDSDGSRIPLVKLADYGNAVSLHEGKQAWKAAGSLSYMAPEILKREEYSFEADVWSLGVVLFMALSGLMPFGGRNKYETFASICKSGPDYTSDAWPAISNDARGLVQWMLTDDPRYRATTCDILTNPWIARHSPTSATAVQSSSM